MRVLWLTYGLPWPPDAGTRIRDYNLIREVARSARIHLVSLVRANAAADSAPLRRLCETVEALPLPVMRPASQLAAVLGCLFERRPIADYPNFSSSAAARLRAIIATRAIDILQVEHSLLGAYGEAASSNGPCRTILSFHNVASEQYRRMANLETGLPSQLLYRLKARLMRRAEIHYLGRFDGCVVVSQAEGDRLHGLRPGIRPIVIDNGVDCDGQRPLPDRADPPTILFPGMMDYPPNTDGILHFCRSILPAIRESVPEVRVLVVGHAPPPEVTSLARDPGIQVTGWVPDMQPYYEQATIVIAPLRAGGGTRIKILESMARGRAVVSTSAGCDGLDLVHDHDILIADEPRKFAACASKLILDRELRTKIAANARRLAEERYAWPAIATRLVDLYRRLLASGPAK